MVLKQLLEKEERNTIRKKRTRKFTEVLGVIEELARSKQDMFKCGHNGLQAYWGRAIQSYLKMVVHNHRGLIDASKRAAESQGLLRTREVVWFKVRREVG